MLFMNKQSSLTTNQYGFRENLSTTNLVVKTSHLTYNN